MSEKAIALPDASSGPRSARSIVSMSEGSRFTPEQVELVKRTVCRGASDDELSLFLHVAQRSGLDPFAKQIYAIRRRVKVDGQYREVMTIQTGIDGFRVVAARTSQHAGTDDAVFREGNGHPESATVTVWKIVGGLRVSYTATARWAEYVQTYQDGNPSGMWAKMPYTMLAKCAESLALRKAFPMDLSGIYSQEEMTQAEVAGEDLAHPPVTVAPATETTARQIESAPEPVAPTAPPAAAAAPAPAPVVDPLTDEQRVALRERWEGLEAAVERAVPRAEGQSRRAAAGQYLLKEFSLDFAAFGQKLRAGVVSRELAAAVIGELDKALARLAKPKPAPAKAPAPVAATAAAPTDARDPFAQSEQAFDDEIPF